MNFIMLHFFAGYGKLTPKTVLGKIVTILYAVIGVPLMLILLSAFGNLLASGARKTYSILSCQKTDTNLKNPTVGYHKAPTSPTGRIYGKHLEGEAAIKMCLSFLLQTYSIMS